MKENKTFLYLIIILVLISIFSSLYYFSVTSKKLSEITSKIDGLKEISKPTLTPSVPPLPPELKIGDKAPLFRMLSLKGVWYNLYHYRDKKNVILVAWVVICPHCKKILGKFNAFCKELNKNEAELLSVVHSSSEEEKKEIKELVKREKINFPVLLSIDESFGIDYKITAVPIVWLINKKGEISKIYKLQELEEKDLKKIFKEFLK